MRYLCSAYGCGNPIPRKFYFCKSHYEMIPYRFKEAMVDTYKKGQLKTEQVPMEFVEVLAEAAKWIATQEEIID